MSEISAVIITFNEAENIERCLQSLKSFVDEIIVVDAHSSDQTRDICEAQGARVFLREWQGYASAKNFGNRQAAHAYIFSIDADEVVSEALAQSIRRYKANLSGVYLVNRLTSYCGHWVRHCGWYPDRKVRLFPKDACLWKGDFVHEHLECPAHLNRTVLHGDLLHYSFISLSDHVQRIDHYSGLASEELFQSGKKANWIQLLFNPPAKFLKTFIVKQGFRDGFYGFCIAALSGFDVFLRYAKLQHLHRRSRD